MPSRYKYCLIVTEGFTLDEEKYSIPVDYLLTLLSIKTQKTTERKFSNIDTLLQYLF